MAYISHESVIAAVGVKTVAALTIPANATHAELQATVANVNYTMDGTSAPTATTVGMVLLAAEQPKLFLVEDLRNIIFIRGSGADGNLNIHYIAGRDV